MSLLPSMYKLIKDTMATAASATVAGFMFFFMMAAASAVKDTFETEREAIEAIPVDEEVKKADSLAQQRNVAYQRAIVWVNVPIWAKACLILAVATVIGCCFLLVGYSSQCFAEYDLMYTISENLGGKWYNLVLPLGRIALLLTVVSYVCLSIFQSWASHETEHILESVESEEGMRLLDTEAPNYAA